MSSLSSEPHIVAAPNEYRLLSPPNDGISHMQFSPSTDSKLLIASSWDCTVRVYDVGTSTQNFERANWTHNSAALCCSFLVIFIDI
jgi:WD40 repeat protein